MKRINEISNHKIERVREREMKRHEKVFFFIRQNKKQREK